VEPGFRIADRLQPSVSDSVEPLKTRFITEGNTRLVVPADIEPSKYPSFFNPRGKFVRDVSIVCYDAFARVAGEKGYLEPKLNFADSLCGTGARGVRVATELPSFYDQIFLNDVSSTSLALAGRSAKENGVDVSCSFSQEETCGFLMSRDPNRGDRFDVIDIDPFGTPSPFVDCALRAVKHHGMLSVSATDTAVLCGVYPKVAQRKYLGLPLRTDYSHEIGMRLIFGLLSMTAMRLESSITPLFCHHDMHYFRAYCSVEIGNNYSRQNEREIGFVSHCFKCGYRGIMSRDELTDDMRKHTECPSCKTGSLKFGGPLWTGNIQSSDFVVKCAEISGLSLFQPEADLPLYYDLSKISDSLEIRTPRIADVIRELESAGHSASRTRLNPNAVRTDAPLQEVQSILARLSRKTP
jgi:tRNA (guanine26-N2/guanine27-N2)-dimethyltransferase